MELIDKIMKEFNPNWHYNTEDIRILVERWLPKKEVAEECIDENWHYLCPTNPSIYWPCKNPNCEICRYIEKIKSEPNKKIEPYKIIVSHPSWVTEFTSDSPITAKQINQIL